MDKAPPDTADDGTRIIAGGRELASEYVAIPIEIPDGLPRTILTAADLPLDWDAPRHPASTQQAGTHWASNLESAVLVVPPAVLPREFNYLLNPLHPGFARISFLEAEPFRFDARLRDRQAIATARTIP